MKEPGSAESEAASTNLAPPSGSDTEATRSDPSSDRHSGSEPFVLGSSSAEGPRKRRLTPTAEVVVLVAVALVLAVLVKTFLVQAFFIPSLSMDPTLKIGDRVLVNKLAYDFHPPSRGDVIVFTDPKAAITGAQASSAHRNPIAALFHWLGQATGLAQPSGEDFIKRVVGLPGETLQGKDGQVWVNGKPLSEPYLNGIRTGDFAPVAVPQGDLFVMGDNRGNSNDSRYGLGFIPISDVIGKAFVIIWPTSRAGWL